MSAEILKSSLEWLNDLVAFDTVSTNSNLELIDAVQVWLHQNQVDTKIIFGQNKTKANLFGVLHSATGDDNGGIIFSGHTDVVPAQRAEWNTDPFSSTIQDNKIFGRGTADMKGFIAVALSLLPEIKKMHLSFPIYYALSYDEEVGCKGIGSLIAEVNNLKVKPKLCIVGEPTNMDLVIAHKGIQTYRCRIKGLAKHSSLTPLGCNAIDYAAKLICFIRDYAEKLSNSGLCDKNYDVPFSTISTDMVKGGIVHNMIPDCCEFVFETRNLPDINPEAFIKDIAFYIAELQAEMCNKYANAAITLEKISYSPCFNSSLDLTEDFFSKINNKKQIRKAAYATEAGYFEEIGIKTIVCGPGEISQAHQINEYVTIEQLNKCADFLQNVCNCFNSR